MADMTNYFFETLDQADTVSVFDELLTIIHSLKDGESKAELLAIYSILTDRFYN